jgi:hypothetical protein
MSGEQWRRVVGWSEVVFGGLGLVFLPIDAVRNPYVTNPSAYIAGSVILFGLSLAAGLLLLRRRPAGVPLSICVLVPQVVWVSVPSFQIKFISGLLAGLQITSTTVSMRFGFEMAAWVGPNVDPEPYLLVVNAFPLLALRGLWRISRATTVEPSSAQQPMVG